MERKPITVTLPDGSTKDGVAFETTPLDIANSIAKSLAKKAIVAMVTYSERFTDAVKVADCEEDDEQHPEVSGDGELWDMGRPLEGNCQLVFKTYDDPEGQMVRPWAVSCAAQ